MAFHNTIRTLLPTDTNHADNFNEVYGQLLENDLSLLGTFSNPNLLINGDFQVWQRGTDKTSTASNQYLIDRWAVYYDNKVRAISNTNTSPAPVKNSASFLNVGTAPGHIWIGQTLEDYSALEGKVVTLSGYIRGIGGFTGKYNISFGAVATSGVTLTSDWQRFEFTVTATFGSIVRQRGIFFNSGTANYPPVNGGIELAGVKLELGSVATPFVPRDDELQRCQKYFINFGTYCGVTGFATAANANNSIAIYINIPTPLMRTIPTTSYSTANINNFIVSPQTGKILITGVSVSSIDGGVARCLISFDGSIPAYTVIGVLIISLAFDAEIYS